MDDKLAAALLENNISPDGFEQKTKSGTVYSGVLPAGMNRVEAWLALVKAAPHSGYFPVLRGDPNSVYGGYHENPDTIVAKAPVGAMPTILEPLIDARLASFRHMREMLPDIAQDLPLDRELVDIDELARAVDNTGIYSFGGRPTAAAPWPGTMPADTKIKFHTISELKGKPCGLSMVKAAKGFEAFAHIVFEPGESGLYTPELLVSVFRQWRDQYRIAPAVITGDTVECVVLQPPTTETDCMKLAAQQWMFCEDIVGQGTQSVRNLALELFNKRTWFFWWD